MKLDYLQLLELEVFTRFGSRLEASMEDKIKRRRILREIFKQERLVPATPEFQFAWMRAYHEGMFNSVEARATGHVLRQFKEVVEQSSLTLADSRQRWCDLILPMRETPLVH